VTENRRKNLKKLQETSCTYASSDFSDFWKMFSVCHTARFRWVSEGVRGCATFKVSCTVCSGKLVTMPTPKYSRKPSKPMRRSQARNDRRRLLLPRRSCRRWQHLTLVLCGADASRLVSFWRFEAPPHPSYSKFLSKSHSQRQTEFQTFLWHVTQNTLKKSEETEKSEKMYMCPTLESMRK
jgi:hypothetical protein